MITAETLVSQAYRNTEPLPGELFDFGYLNAFLLHGVAVANSNLIVFERLMINRDAERGSDFILAAIELSDSRRVVIHGAYRARALQTIFDLFCEVDYALFIFRERQHGHFYRRKLRMQPQHYAFPVAHFFFGVSVHQKGQHLAINSG